MRKCKSYSDVRRNNFSFLRFMKSLRSRDGYPDEQTRKSKRTIKNVTCHVKHSKKDIPGIFRHSKTEIKFTSEEGTSCEMVDLSEHQESTGLVVNNADKITSFSEPSQNAMTTGFVMKSYITELFGRRIMHTKASQTVPICQIRLPTEANSLSLPGVVRKIPNSKSSRVDLRKNRRRFFSFGKVSIFAI